MTREEAIDLLDNLIGMVEDNHNSDYDMALKMAIKALNSNRFISLDVYNQVTKERDIAIEQLHELGYEFGQKIEPTTKNNLGVREFEEIVINYPPEDLCAYPEYKGKPYFGIKYKENGEEIVGFGTYKPEVLSQYLKDYFISTTKNNLGIKLEEQTEKELDVKTNLGVDCISRAEVLKLMKDNWHTHNGDWAMQESMDDIRALPSATPIRPKGRWIDHSDEGYVECPKCGSATNCDDNISDLHFCFSCGAKMEEVEE